MSVGRHHRVRDDVHPGFSRRRNALRNAQTAHGRRPLGEVHTAIGRLSELTPHSHWSEVVDADLGFHHALARAVGSPRLERLYLSMSGEIRLCIAQLRPSWQSPTHMSDEHRELLAVIESGDVVAAEARMAAHLERAVRDLTHA